jgi:hypothetical protein
MKAQYQPEYKYTYIDILQARQHVDEIVARPKCVIVRGGNDLALGLPHTLH